MSYLKEYTYGNVHKFWYVFYADGFWMVKWSRAGFFGGIWMARRLEGWLPMSKERNVLRSVQARC